MTPIGGSRRTRASPAAREGRRIDASIEELQREIEELRASRGRIVHVADSDRRRIERALHDGVQQHLVALAVNLQLARQLVKSDPDGAHALLTEMGQDVRDALESVRGLANEIYPPLLFDRGLVDAIRSAAASASIPAKVAASAVGRYPPEVEGAVYFCCLEALRNASRHAGPGARANVRLSDERSTLSFEIVDDGVGFDEGAPRHGAGLANLADRLAALGGALAIFTQPGKGTRVSGTVPLTR